MFYSLTNTRQKLFHDNLKNIALTYSIERTVLSLLVQILRGNSMFRLFLSWHSENVGNNLKTFLSKWQLLQGSLFFFLSVLRRISFHEVNKYFLHRMNPIWPKISEATNWKLPRYVPVASWLCLNFSKHHLITDIAHNYVGVWWVQPLKVTWGFYDAGKVKNEGMVVKVHHRSWKLC